jgi:hypothetical protein
MKTLTQTSKKRGFLPIAALWAGYCLYLVFAGMSGELVQSREVQFIHWPFIPDPKIAYPGDSEVQRDSLHRINPLYLNHLSK